MAAVEVGRVKLCTFSPLSLVGVHWSMFYGSNTCFFFIRPSLLCSPLSAAIILPRRRFVVVVVVVYSPPSLKHRHRMRISLHRCSELQAIEAEGEDWRGRTTYYTRAARTLRGVQLQYYCLVWPVRDCPGGKRIPRVLRPSPHLRRRKFLR